jgi:hypothetical protein
MNILLFVGDRDGREVDFWLNKGHSFFFVVFFAWYQIHHISIILFDRKDES